MFLFVYSIDEHINQQLSVLLPGHIRHPESVQEMLDFVFRQLRLGNLLICDPNLQIFLGCFQFI